MANEEHLAILRQGVEVWNAWREANRNVRPDLRMTDLFGSILLRADLSWADLSWADLSGCDFFGADFFGADLSGTMLSGTKLSRAILSGVDLSGADLSGANLSRATLSKANLTWADCFGATFSEANLSEANLSGCQFGRALVANTIFANVDLRGVHGLDTVHHRGPSIISIDTLYRSHGQIPEVFLRGCGVPDSMIEYARSLVTAERPIDYYSCFISYSSADTALAERLYADLQAKGARCWLAPHDLTPGEVIVRGIDEAIRLHDKVVLLLSEAAVTSPWVAYEVNLATTREAREGRTVLYPLRLDDAVLTTAQGWAVMLRDSRHIGDFRQWTEYAAYQAVFGRLLRDLKAEQR